MLLCVVRRTSGGADCIRANSLSASVLPSILLLPRLSGTCRVVEMPVWCCMRLVLQGFPALIAGCFRACVPSLGSGAAYCTKLADLVDRACCRAGCMAFRILDRPPRCPSTCCTLNWCGSTPSSLRRLAGSAIPGARCSGHSSSVLDPASERIRLVLVH